MRSSITLAELFREYDLWNAEVAACTKLAVGQAVRSLHGFYRWRYEAEHGSAPASDWDVEVEAVTPRAIGRWRSWLIQGLCRRPVSVHTVHSYHAALRQLWRYGEELAPPLVQSNPVAAVRNRRPADAEPDVWDRSEIAALLRAVRRMRWRDGSMRIRWTALLYGLLHGLRINEVTTLRRIDLRPAERLVLIRARDDCPGQWWQWQTKGRRDRAVGISGRYARVLARLLERCSWMFPHLSERACRRRVAGIGQLTWRQKQQPYSTVNRDFDAIVAAANAVRLEKGQPTIATAYPHMGRQTAATQLAVDRVNPKVAATIMGWADASTGYRHYQKVEQALSVTTSRASFRRLGRQLGNKDSNLD